LRSFARSERILLSLERVPGVSHLLLNLAQTRSPCFHVAAASGGVARPAISSDLIPAPANRRRRRPRAPSRARARARTYMFEYIVLACTVLGSIFDITAHRRVERSFLTVYIQYWI